MVQCMPPLAAIAAKLIVTTPWRIRMGAPAITAAIVSVIPPLARYPWLADRPASALCSTHGTPSMLRVEEINSLAQLQPHRLRWRKLLGETRSPSFFQSQTWLEAYWHAFGRDGRLCVLIVHAGGEVLGIVPLVTCNRRTRLGNCRVLSYPVLGSATFFGPIGPNPTACLLAALRHLQQTPRDWDVLELAAIDPTVDCGRTEHALRRVGLPARRSTANLAAVVRLDADWQPYWASRSERCRQTVRRAESKLSATGNVQYVHYRPGGTAQDEDDPRWDLFNACQSISRQTQAGSQGSISPLANPIAGPFFRDLHPVAVAAGAADLHLLLVDESPVAFVYGYSVHGHAVALESAAHPAVQYQGAGTVLMARLLERCCQQGDRRYTFPVRSLRRVRRWLTDLVAGEQYTYYARTPRMQLLRFTHSLVGVGPV